MSRPERVADAGGRGRQEVAWIGLGANLPGLHGGPSQMLQAASIALAESSWLELRQHSTLYRSQARGGSPQPDFANQVIEATSALSPEALLASLLALEALLGRERSVRNAPRSIDIDLLLFADCVRTQPGLTLPHPRLHERRFVLVPLAELAPGLVHPVRGRTIAELLEACADDGWVVPWDPVPEPGTAKAR